MFTAFAEALPIAVGMVLATLPLVSVSLLLVSRPDRTAYATFLGGWGTGAACVAVLAIAVSDLSTPNQAPPAPWVVWLRLILGLGLIALAIQKLVRRGAPDADSAPPKWMQALRQMRPLKTYALGAGLAAFNPKNAALIASGALTVAAKTYAPVAQIGAMAGFIVVSSAGLTLPLAMSLLLGARAERPLQRLSGFMTRYSKLLVAVVLLVLGGLVLANALSDL